MGFAHIIKMVVLYRRKKYKILFRVITRPRYYFPAWFYNPRRVRFSLERLRLHTATPGNLDKYRILFAVSRQTSTPSEGSGARYTGGGCALGGNQARTVLRESLAWLLARGRTNSCTEKKSVAKKRSKYVYSNFRNYMTCGRQISKFLVVKQNLSAYLI